MESVPQTPGQQTRNAVTRRIIAHVTAGWPRLGEPLVRHRGQYSESELPGSFGPATGTPEQGIDDTFILYAGPPTGN
jgi:hypothetical protein